MGPVSTRREAPRGLDEVRAAVVAALGVGDAEPISALLRRHARDVGQYEASVRSDGSALRGGRMMIEQAPYEVARAVAAALAVDLPPVAAALGELAAELELPSIVGWDLRGGDPCVKLYLNASDASSAVRADALERLGLAVDDPAVREPAVIGVNAGRGGHELKLYVQHRDALPLAAPLGPAARALAEAATEEGASAAAVASWEVVDGAARPRAFFVALRDRPDGAWRAVTGLPGWDPGEARRALPFSPGPARSVGVAVDAPERWTVYFKPAGGDRPVHALEPTAVFRAPAAEVGVFVEPRSQAVRAYARTERHAISVRPREGEASTEALEQLMAWVVDRVRAAERGEEPPGALLRDPPSPWVDLDG